MKANENDYNKYSEAIDRIQEGNETMIELFNELEGDDPMIKFDNGVMETIERAKKKYGDDMVDKKLNNVVREMLSWLDLEDVDIDLEEGEKEDDQS
ncbi:voltage-gated potassium channel [Virgibacillus natechei]|uniref:Voltage-gated potassium channel n=1 Tax=Virgibacillus natechei TaxID=1216297 RepID=A0ABS4IDU4_9BACI|nr:atypical membrane-integrating protein (Mistic protein) [Virgibacillus natechei]MBP1969115.1 voltage-gated potassium channel [Virgibacillus natechei]UZD14381.1 atypical membrane-integrating protein (Mistic protein) [Virgibacillus natechei]